MSRTIKKCRWWTYFWRPSFFLGPSWYNEKPWKTQADKGRRYKVQRGIQQRKFRQATRQALKHERECPRLPPFDWWEVD
jgi:hypothetical protein